MDNFLHKKWQKFHDRVSLFNHLPFIDFVLASGSMAMGTAKESSDFDVIVGVKSGRIFTARFLAILFSSFMGIRAKGHDNLHDKKKSADKICLNHFVTYSSYKLSPPYNLYWKKLYESLVPMIGDKEAIKNFFENNNWLDIHMVKNKHENVRAIKKSLLGRAFEFTLSGKAGDWVESTLKRIQVKKIEKGLNAKEHYKPRIIYSDLELEFHPHTKRIEEYVASQVA